MCRGRVADLRVGGFFFLVFRCSFSTFVADRVHEGCLRLFLVDLAAFGVSLEPSLCHFCVLGTKLDL